MVRKRRVARDANARWLVGTMAVAVSLVVVLIVVNVFASAQPARVQQRQRAQREFLDQLAHRRRAHDMPRRIILALSVRGRDFDAPNLVVVVEAEFLQITAHQHATRANALLDDATLRSPGAAAH